MLLFKPYNLYGKNDKYYEKFQNNFIDKNNSQFLLNNAGSAIRDFISYDEVE